MTTSPLEAKIIAAFADNLRTRATFDVTAAAVCTARNFADMMAANGHDHAVAKSVALRVIARHTIAAINAATAEVAA